MTEAFGATFVTSVVVMTSTTSSGLAFTIEGLGSACEILADEAIV